MVGWVYAAWATRIPTITDGLGLVLSRGGANTVARLGIQTIWGCRPEAARR
jgi:hypothetical protein